MEHGLCTEALVTRVIDGDTVEVEIKRRFNIRIRDIDCPERNTKEGQKAKAYVEKLILDTDVDIFIPSKNPIKLMDINSFNRLVGDIHVREIDENLATILKEKGYVKDEKKDY